MEKNYMAYTYYLRNAGKEDLGYVASITLDSCSKGAEEAVRVAVWRMENALFMQNRLQMESQKKDA